MKVNYNPAQLREIMSTQNPISCTEYRSPQRNGSLSPNDFSRFEQTMPALKSKNENDEYDDAKKVKRTNLFKKPSDSPQRESAHQRTLSNNDKEFLTFSMNQTRVQTASDRLSKVTAFSLV